jgi:D-3-phosphoglycerate dehydrogenase
VRILLTTTSYQDTPGEHHDLLAASGHEVVTARGPLSEREMLERIADAGPFDATLNGDDIFSPRVIDALGPALRCISKYGIGLDKIDVEYATRKKVAVLFTPGVNHTTVAEHAIGLMIAVAKGLYLHASEVKAGRWTRRTGRELMGKTLGIAGMGRIGREVAVRARAFGMRVIGYDIDWDADFATGHGVDRCEACEQLFERSDVISLHLPANEQTVGLVNAESIRRIKDGAILINTARGTLVDEAAVADACRSGKLTGYGTDVLEPEPMTTPHPFQQIDNIIVTPHIGSRTHESVQRQAMRATRNTLNFLAGDEDYIQANKTDE